MFVENFEGHFVLVARYVHIVAASLWLGEVAVINFILIPALSRHEGEARKAFLNSVFPRVFRMASILSGTTAVSGATIFHHYHGFRFAHLTEDRSDIALLIAATLGALLTFFHFFMENHMARRVGVGDPCVSPEKVEDVHSKLKIVPRVGLVVISTIYLLMLYSVRS